MSDRRLIPLLFITAAISIFVLTWCGQRPAHSKPARHPVTEFAGDRYAPQMAQGASSRDVTNAVKERRGARPRPGKRQRVPIPRPRPGDVTPLIHGGRPAGCPARAWCGCWLAAHLGIRDRTLWLARNWARIGRPASAQPGAIVVWGRHVGKVTDVAPGRIKVLSGNDGRMVRERWRPARGVLAYRML